jgi:hypothetical protein
VIDSLNPLSRKRGEIDGERDVKALVEESEERGREAGLYNLSDAEAVNLLDARLRAAAAARFRLPAMDAASVADLLSALGAERINLEAKATEASSRIIEKPLPPAVTGISHRKAFLNSFALFALVGFAAKAAGFQIDWSGGLALGLCALIVAVNRDAARAFLVSLPARVAFLLRLVSRRLALFRLRRRIALLERRQASISEEVALGALRRSQAAEWVSEMRPLVLSHFEYERAKAQRAASVQKGKPQAALPQIEISEDYNSRAGSALALMSAD